MFLQQNKKWGKLKKMIITMSLVSVKLIFSHQVLSHIIQYIPVMNWVPPIEK